jgi:hypothetical protein
MPPAKRNPDDVQTLKEKLHGAHAIAGMHASASGNTNAGANSNAAAAATATATATATAGAGANARGRRTAQPAASSALKEVDNASTNSGHTATDASSSHVRRSTHGLPSPPADTPRR